MPGLLPHIDPDGLLEYSVVFTDRSLNHMSQRFQAAMRDMSAWLKEVYRADAVALVPGGGSFGMEAVARQFAHGKNVLVIRNGWFSYRWTQIFEAGQIPATTTVMQARPVTADSQAAFAPAPIDEVIATIRSQRPDLVCAPHVETASGMLLPDDYLRQLATAVHEVGGLLVLDGIASGCLWVDMQDIGVDVLISAPQKGWSSTPCAAMVMLSAKASQYLETTQSSSFAADLKRWRAIMAAYENGGHAYHATLPTDGLLQLHAAMQETRSWGLERARDAQRELGRQVRQLLESRGFPSVAAAGFQAPGVVVSYTQDTGIHKGTKFIAAGLQTAAGVPLQCAEPADFQTFRIGLFGLDKLQHIERTVDYLKTALDQM